MNMPDYLDDNFSMSVVIYQKNIVILINLNYIKNG